MNFFVLYHNCLITLVCITNFFSDVEAQFYYRNNKQMLEYLEDFEATSSLNTTLFSIGNSVSGIPLSVMEINQPGEQLGVPNIKFIANIHGNEVLGREILLTFLLYLEKRYPVNARVKCLLDNARIFVLPSMNPDGFDKTPEGICVGGKGRRNLNDVDLNRNFPDFSRENSSEVRKDAIQPETAALMEWMNQTTFVLSASLHSGALVASYPYDSFRTQEERGNQTESKTPDQDVFVHLAKTYAKYHGRMHQGIVCPMDDSKKAVFPQGITNGANWYSLKGGMQDYNYIKHGVMELSLELSCCKYPSEERLPAHIQENIEPLLRFGLQALRGVKGLVLDSVTNKTIAGATLKIKDRDIPFRSSENGEFWRILLPGTYNISVEASGYQPQSKAVTVQDIKENECPNTNMTLFYLTPTKN